MVKRQANEKVAVEGALLDLSDVCYTGPEIARWADAVHRQDHSPTVSSRPIAIIPRKPESGLTTTPAPSSDKSLTLNWYTGPSGDRTRIMGRVNSLDLPLPLLSAWQCFGSVVASVIFTQELEKKRAPLVHLSGPCRHDLSCFLRSFHILEFRFKGQIRGTFVQKLLY